MKFNVYVKLRGVREIEVPIKGNPIECESLPKLLKTLDVPESTGVVKITGIRIEEINEV